MIGKCGNCDGSFEIEIFHCGFGEESYAYCDTCGTTCLLSCWSKLWPQGVKCSQGEIAPEMEPYLRACLCGGRFTKGNSPRCPLCKTPLSADEAAEYLEAQAPGTKRGWRWQRNWSGTYAAVINHSRVVDHFRSWILVFVRFFCLWLKICRTLRSPELHLVAALTFQITSHEITTWSSCLRALLAQNSGV